MFIDSTSNSVDKSLVNIIDAVAANIVLSLNEVQTCSELANLLDHPDEEVRTEAYLIYEGINQLKLQLGKI